MIKTNKPLKVLMIGKLPDSISGGVEKYTKLLLEKLIDIDFYVLSQCADDLPSRLKNKITVIPYPGFIKNNQFLRCLFFSVNCVIYTPFLLFRYKPDLVHIQYGNFFDPLLIVIPRLMGFKTIVTMHVSNLWRHFKIKFLRKISVFLLYHADGIICISYLQSQMLIKLKVPRRKLNYIPLCIEDEFFELPKTLSNKKKFRLLYLGRVVREKGILELVRAFWLVKKQITSMELLIVGPVAEPFNREIGELISRLKIEDIILYGPEINLANKIKLYDSADVFIYPSYVDTLPLSIIEALSRGCPVIASNVAGIPYLVQSAGLLVPSGNIQKLKDAIVIMCQSKEKRLAYSAKAVLQVPQYRCKNVLEQHRILYNSFAK